jgi:hypothetical protein
MKRYLTAGLIASFALAFGLAPSAGASVASKGKPKNTKAENALINNHVPPNTASSCQGDTKQEKASLIKDFPSQKSHINAIAAAVQCFPTAQGSPDVVYYVQMKTLNDLLDLYQANLTFYNVSGGPGPSKDASGSTPGPTASTCPLENTWGPPAPGGGGGTNSPVGRVICEPSTSSHSGDLVWTQEPLKIYSEAFVKTDPTGSLLLNFFQGADSGPEG